MKSSWIMVPSTKIKFIDLGRDYDVVSAYGSENRQAGHRGRERTGSTCDGSSLITTLLKLDSDEGGWPSSLYKVGLFEADIGLMISL
jgi:hypothetical protein